jgi:hypothetical protein
MCCDDCHLLLKIMYTCGVKGPMQRVDEQGDACNPGRSGEGASHVGQFSPGLGPD